MSKPKSVKDDFYPTGGGAGAATLSREERFLSPKALAIAAEEERRSDQRHAENEALRTRLASIDSEIADAEIALSAARRARKPDSAVEARYEALIEAGKARKRNEQKRHDERRAKTAGSVSTYTRDFLRKVNRPTRDCDTPVPSAPGKTERQMMDILREQHAAKRMERKAVVRAPRTADEITAEISIGVNRMGTASVSAALRQLRSVALHEDINKLDVLRFEPPKIAVADGLGGVSYVPDGAALLFALFPEQAKSGLYALALAGHNEADAMSMEDRRDAVNTINAEMLQIERASEALVRHCFEAGIEPGARITSNPLAILDVEFV